MIKQGGISRCFLVPQIKLLLLLQLQPETNSAFLVPVALDRYENGHLQRTSQLLPKYAPRVLEYDKTESEARSRGRRETPAVCNMEENN